MTNPLVFIILGIVYAALKIYFEKRFAPLDATGEQRRLADLAFACGHSEYDLFVISGEGWNTALTKIDQDFKKYLKTGYMPAYVRDFLRRHPDNNDQTYQMLIYSGGRPPYL